MTVMNSSAGGFLEDRSRGTSPPAPGSGPGARLRAAVAEESPLQVCGVPNAYCAHLATRVGFRVLYVSGGGVAAGSCGMPDLGLTTMEDVRTDVERVTHVCHTPVLVDVDTGWGGAFNIARTVRTMERAGAAGLHLEDQIAPKRCGHRPGKALVPTDEMVDRVKAAVDARGDTAFVIMARTDALAQEGEGAGIERLQRCVEAGADMVFPEAVATLEAYGRIAAAVSVPVLANITEFGITPLFTVDALRGAGVRLVLYPLTAFRAMSQAALDVYRVLRDEGSQQSVVDRLQTREELYDILNYHAFEQKLDHLFSQ